MIGTAASFTACSVYAIQHQILGIERLEHSCETEVRIADEVGFIGLGNIGNPMSRPVLEVEFSLVVYDANPAAIHRLVKEGAEAAPSPKDAASRARKICSSLPTSPIVETVCLGKNGIIKDLATALSLGKEAGVPILMAGLAQQLYQLAQSIQGPLAPNQSAIKLYEEWAGIENRTK
jgi:3-hydroxyisobutyrate dehydrogenase